MKSGMFSFTICTSRSLKQRAKIYFELRLHFLHLVSLSTVNLSSEACTLNTAGQGASISY
jgi:hypothetical protein